MKALLKKALKAARLLKSQTYLVGLAKGAAASVEHENALKHGAFATVVDIGANRGQFSLTAAHLFPAAEIYAFEPLTQPAAVYRRVFANNPRVHLFAAAVGPKTGRADMHVSARDDSSSLLPITQRQDDVFPGTGEVGREQVTIGPLDSFIDQDEIQPPALLKLDVQGFELEALKGCDHVLKRFDNVYVEASFVELYAGQALASEIIDHLRRCGFSVAGIYNLAFDGNGRSIQADFMFARGESDAQREAVPPSLASVSS